MSIRKSTLMLLLSLGLIAPVGAQTTPDEITLSLRIRDAKTGQVVIKPLKIDPRKVGIVIVDPWNYHWCMTWTEQAGGMTPRMNRALEGCRKLGMTVLWGPTDTASMFSGWLQRQRAMAVPYLPVPNVRKAECHWTVPWGNCLCGPGAACVVNYGWDGMDPRLEIAESDLIVSGTQELYSICQARGITLLIYFGGATNICLTGKDVGLGPMYAAGPDTIFARDLAFAWTTYNPATGYTPSTGNAQAADDLERAGIPTVSFVEELRQLKLWDEAWITEPVRITPAGTPNRPYLFEKSVDDNMLSHELGRSIAMYPSVVFKVFIDGRLAAESPVTRISQAPWRFDVPIPPGARQIVLVCDDAGSRSPYDLGDWVEAGFVLKKT